LRVDHHAQSGDVRVLFEGDAEEPTEKRLLEHKDELRAEVLKVAHHGSQHSSTDALVAAVSPRLAVISCGLGNDYGHPHARSLARLEHGAGAIARTDLQGDVTVTSDERGLSWTTDRPATPVELRTPGKGGQ
jgi:competence protein ComEC